MMKKLLGVGGLVVALLVGAGFGNIVGQEASTSFVARDNRETGASYGEMLRQVAERLNESTPLQVDAETVLESVDSRRRKIIYNYVLVNTTGSTVDRAAFLTRMRPRVRGWACGNPEMNAFWKRGISAVYSYEARNGADIGNILVGPQDCGY